MISFASASAWAAPPMSFFISRMPLAGLMSRPPLSKQTPLPTIAIFGCAFLAPVQLDQARRALARRALADGGDHRIALVERIAGGDFDLGAKLPWRASRAAASSSAGPMSAAGVSTRSRTKRRGLRQAHRPLDRRRLLGQQDARTALVLGLGLVGVRSDAGRAASRASPGPGRPRPADRCLPAAPRPAWPGTRATVRRHWRPSRPPPIHGRAQPAGWRTGRRSCRRNALASSKARRGAFCFFIQSAKLFLSTRWIGCAGPPRSGWRRREIRSCPGFTGPPSRSEFVTSIERSFAGRRPAFVISAHWLGIAPQFLTFARALKRKSVIGQSYCGMMRNCSQRPCSPVSA